MPRIVPAIAAVVLLVFPALVTAQRIAGPHPDKTIPAPVELPNKGFNTAFSRVGEDLYIAGQPTADALRDLHKRGVTTVVNLRTPEEMKNIGFDEAALVASLGMKYVFLPVRGDDEFPYAPATVTAFSRALAEANGPVLLHCTVAWRASHLWAAYLIRERGISPDSALANARAINLMDMHHSGIGRQPVEDFLGRDLDELSRYRTP
ncbi:MAG: beta-lactamase hydrolase domain-containing protein [Gemmatimonadaceae bacterium]